MRTLASKELLSNDELKPTNYYDNTTFPNPESHFIAHLGMKIEIRWIPNPPGIANSSAAFSPSYTWQIPRYPGSTQPGIACRKKNLRKKWMEVYASASGRGISTPTSPIRIQ
jgi:hypothetical protein